MNDPHLVIAAYWSTETPKEATDRLADAIDGNTVRGSGSVVSVIAPDAELYAFLRAVHLEEAADFGDAREAS